MGDGGEDRTRSVLIGIGLIAIGTFIGLSLIPIGVFGDRAAELFPSRNFIGPVGSIVSTLLVGAFGVTAAFLPLLPTVWGISALVRLDRRETVRWTAFLCSATFLLPPLLAALTFPAVDRPIWLVGSYGEWAAGQLASALSWIGALLLLAVLFLVAIIASLGLEPFLAAAHGAKAVRLGAASAARRARAALSAGWIAVGWLADSWQRVRVASRQLAARLEGRTVRGPLTEPEAGEAGEGQIGPPDDWGAVELQKRRKAKRTPLPPEVLALDADLPPLELLAPVPEQRYTVSPQALDRLGETLVETLKTFKVDCSIAGRTTGPVVTQFEVVPAAGVKVGKIAALADDLALALKAPSIRVIAPIPGKGAVGVEVPNPRRKIVYLREILESDSYRTSRAQLPLALGEDVHGRSDVYDLAQMPHLLIAGVTGSGKSVCINAIISSLIYRYTPEQLRLLLIDPKMVELGGYNVLPHLRHPVVTDNNDAATVLKWLVYEMERRYEWLSANGCRNLREYNNRVARGNRILAPNTYGGGDVEEPEILPYVVLVIDELADLMMTVQAEVERPLAYLAQKARATGIHLVVATQRPSVNVITGLIKANFPSRIAFRVASKVDSRTIIDQNGAETLLGNGDMLLMPPGQSEPARIQGTFVSTEDTERLMEWYREKAALEDAARKAAGEEDILDAVRQREAEEAESEAGQGDLEDRDPLFRRAAEVVVQHQQGSTSLLQRRLKVGYGRAARIVDQLEQAGIVGPPEGSKPREVLVTLQDLERISVVKEN